MTHIEGIPAEPSQEVIGVLEGGRDALVAEQAKIVELNALGTATNLLVNTGIRIGRLSHRTDSFTTDTVTIGDTTVNLEGEVKYHGVEEPRKPAEATVYAIAKYPASEILPEGGSKMLFSVSGQFDTAGNPAVAETKIGDLRLTRAPDITSRAQLIFHVDKVLRPGPRIVK